MAARPRFLVGSRASQLAMTQTELVCDALSASLSASRKDDFQIVSMTTVGDRVLDVPLQNIGGGDKSLWTKELEVALEAGQVDFVVHSLKDMPTRLPDGMVLAAILEREDPSDVVVFRAGSTVTSLEDLPDGSVIGTSSLRRAAQLKSRFPALTCTVVVRSPLFFQLAPEILYSVAT